LVWAAALVVGLVLIGRGRAPARLWWWSGLAVLTLGSLLIFSDVLDKFVVHARTARLVAPFLCLVAAAVVRQTCARWPGWLGLSAGVLYLTQALLNFSLPLGQMFPEEFLRRASQIEAEVPKERRGNVHIMNGDFLHDPSHVVTLPPGSTVLFSRPHPLQFRPYLYEGYLEEHRRLFEKLDLTMRVADVKLPPNLSQYATVGDLQAFGGYPGPIRLTLELPPMLEPKSEPLLTTGQTTVGDFIYLFYNNVATIRVAFDHWKYGGPSSGNLEIDYHRPLVVTLSTGALFPPASGPEADATRILREMLFVQINDRVIFAQKAPAYPASPNSISFGCNFIGGSTTRPMFTGRILKIETVRPEEILEAIRKKPPPPKDGK
jgi:hypothetical protein